MASKGKDAEEERTFKLCKYLNPRITANNTNDTFTKRGLVTTDNILSIWLTTPILEFDLH